MDDDAPASGRQSHAERRRGGGDGGTAADLVAQPQAFRGGNPVQQHWRLQPGAPTLGQRDVRRGGGPDFQLFDSGCSGSPAGFGTSGISAGWLFVGLARHPGTAEGLPARPEPARLLALPRGADRGRDRCRHRDGHAALLGTDVRRSGSERAGTGCGGHRSATGGFGGGGGSQLWRFFDGL